MKKAEERFFYKKNPECRIISAFRVFIRSNGELYTEPQICNCNAGTVGCSPVSYF